MIKKIILASLFPVILLPGMAWAVNSTPTPTPSITLGVAPSYSVGKYGETTDTKILYVPVYARVQLNDLSLKLVVPYISVESAGSVTSGGTVIGGPGKTAASTSTESGLGDVWLEGRYRFHGSRSAPDVVPYAKVKFGTASYSQGLGTGENDYEAGLGVEWTVGSKIFPFVDGGYRLLGSPPGVSLNDIAVYDAGVIFALNDKNFLTGMFAGHQSAQAGFAAAADAIVAWNYRSAGITLQVFYDQGLSDGSPDKAVGLGIEKRY
jgi:hypothetical protein